jgi:hypothetical protein
MKIKYVRSGKPLSSLRDIINTFAVDEFDSPVRSTVPSLCFWTDAATRVSALAAQLGLPTPVACALEFEFQVAPPRGRGKASHTDVMLTFPDVCIGIEAKFREPLYESVAEWLTGGKSPKNRRDVLAGWLELIASRTGEAITPERVGTIPYQMIHRLASVCAQPQTTRFLVYQMFKYRLASGAPVHSDTRDYRDQLGELLTQLHANLACRMFTWEIQIQPRDLYARMIDLWLREHFPAAPEVIQGIYHRTLTDFGRETLAEVLPV